MPSSTRTAHKLGANRKETAKRSSRARKFSESADAHEDRGSIKSKLSRSQPSFVHLGIPRHSSYTPQRASSPAVSLPNNAKLLPEQCSGTEFRVVHFRLFKEGARNVCVAGSFNDWKPRRTPLHRNGFGEWEVNLSLTPGDYEYRFVVDGQWIDDPLSCSHVPNPFGGVNAVLHVHQQGQ